MIDGRIGQIISEIERLLDESDNAKMKIDSIDLDTEWLRMSVVPKQSGGKAMDYAKLITSIEQKLW